MRKKNEALRQKILRVAMELINSSGVEAINMRTLAEKAGIATGTIYTYFSSKDDILLALTEQHWHEVLQNMRNVVKSDIFYVQIEEVFAFLYKEINQSGGKLMGSLSNVEVAGREKMQSMQQALIREFIFSMEKDETIKDDVWNETFTKKQYAKFITMNLILLLQVKKPDISFFIEIIQRTLY